MILASLSPKMFTILTIIDLIEVEECSPNRGNYRGSGMRSFRYQPYQQFGNMACDVCYQREYQRQKFGSFG